MTTRLLYHQPSEYEMLTGAPNRVVGQFDTDDVVDDWGTGPDSESLARLWLTHTGHWAWTHPGQDYDYACHYVTPAEARTFLVRAGQRDAVAQHLDHAERGRPEVGPEVKVRLPKGVVAAAETLAADNGWSRSETLRVLIVDGLSALSRSVT